MIDDDMVVCPNHQGHFDCTPFCPICEGNQEYNRTENGTVVTEDDDCVWCEKQRCECDEIRDDYYER